MTAKKSNPAKRGPKPKPAGDRQEQLTIRLSPKVKYGLELLAKEQGKSLSQAAEWAVNAALHTRNVGPSYDQLSLWTLVDSTWEEGKDWQRTIAIWNHAPTLIDYGDRLVCRLVTNSLESPSVTEYFVDFEHSDDPTDPHNDKSMRSHVYWSAVEKHWPHIRERVQEIDAFGRDVAGMSLRIFLPEDARPAFDEAFPSSTQAMF